MSRGGISSPSLTILIGAAVMLSLSMGLRQCFGLIMPPLTQDLAVTVSDFTLAMALQNLGWGLFQPIAGALAVRLGFRPVMVAGAALYLIGLLVLASAQGFVGVLVGGGLLVGLALACTASAIALAVGSGWWGGGGGVGGWGGGVLGAVPALACTASAIALAVGSRAAHPARRSM